ncbi:DUF294 nucleotidyltransferase-like domain-containing protein [Fuchsiella alkaliacetigena]|uniref:DUF294 nucleotidyltransferase-like domain-containing protein n=1 Tax=Fuchsiella alkaliacetigena TaxID=957042 RepID=UPI00200AAFA6|nr:DUF294 nucleotidyltransferase-like domain-containing protein [Fuchsiella alkaliacetigena]MCK8823792.1 DUF294 nucleotidyltransferase-like domain-containing protein [Fuchsiella alkaliacetigena]
MEAVKILDEFISSEVSAVELLAKVAPEAKIKSYVEDDYIFEQNEKVDNKLYIILAGFIELVVSNELGISKSIGYRYPGDFLGEEVFSQKQIYSSSAVAADDAKCLVLSKKDLQLLIKEEPQLAEHLIKSLINWKESCYQSLLKREDYQQKEDNALDIHPFRKRVSQVMSSPVATCTKTTPVDQVAEIMQKQNVSSVVVEKRNRPVGIITEKDMVHKLVAAKKDTGQVVAEEIMSTEVITVPKNAFFYQALYNMVKHQLKHVVVVERNVIVGIVTIRDLAQTRDAGLVTIVNEIETKNSVAGLNEARKKVDKVLKALVVEKASTREICKLITEFNDRLTKRVIKLCEEEMKQEGYGVPPVDYCFLQMGSAGRKEQFLRTDQDNAFIFADPEEKEEEVQEYFRILGEKVVDKLVKCGFEECDGGVMVSNHYWRNSFSKWKEIIRQWVADLTFARVRAFNIFFDFRPIYGERYLAQRIREYLIDKFQQSQTTLFYLGKVALYNDLPLGIFGRLITESSEEHRGELNLKLGGSVQMVDCTRAFALKEGITESSTFERLEVLAEKKAISEESRDKFISAYQQLLGLRIRDGLNKVESGQEADNYIDPDQLSKGEYQSLKESLKAVDELMNLTGHAFVI